jgi:hypothetical protein
MTHPPLSRVFRAEPYQQSSVDIEDFVANDIANAIAVAVDNAAPNGTGTAPQPLGIFALSRQRKRFVHVRVAVGKRDLRRGGDVAECAPVRENTRARVDPERWQFRLGL